MKVSSTTINGLDVLILQNDHLKISVVPALGGKVLSVFNKSLRKEFLWTNTKLPLAQNKAGDEYDPNFIGGIDELIPNDIPETIDSIMYPDHGELWITPMTQRSAENTISCTALLPLSGLQYTKVFTLENDRPEFTIAYEIKNTSSAERNFLWKLHAALLIHPGDRLISDANVAKVVDPEYSRFKKELQPFRWPMIENMDASVVPEINGSMDFFYLYEVATGVMQLVNADGHHLFSIAYDKKIFPYQWYFASYGGFLEHYTAILEPCSNMPMSVNEAKATGQTATLQAGATLNTTVKIFAGEKKNYIS